MLFKINFMLKIRIALQSRWNSFLPKLSLHITVCFFKEVNYNSVGINFKSDLWWFISGLQQVAKGGRWEVIIFATALNSGLLWCRGRRCGGSRFIPEFKANRTRDPEETATLERGGRYSDSTRGVQSVRVCNHLDFIQPTISLLKKNKN